MRRADEDEGPPRQARDEAQGPDMPAKCTIKQSSMISSFTRFCLRSSGACGCGERNPYSNY